MTSVGSIAAAPVARVDAENRCDSFVRAEARRPARLVAALLVLVLMAPCAFADPGRIFLKDGAVLRGDITRTDNEVILRNFAGEKRFALADIERIELDAQRSGPASAPVDEPATQPSLEPASQSSKYTGPQPPQHLTARDILRLKLAEYPLDAPAEVVHVEFPRRKNEPPIEDLISRAVKAGASADPDWKSTCETGTPSDKLRLLLETTGLKHMDRVQIRGDTAVFSRFRRDVMPVVARGCIKSGCHGGNNTHVFRFPIGIPSNESYAYTAFIVLDMMRTPAGPMIERQNPEASALLKYLLPPDDPAKPVHSEVRGQKMVHPIRSLKDPKYTEVLEWISSLKVQHPNYDLQTPLPQWLVELSAASVKAPPATASRPADTPPTSRPSEPTKKP